MEHVKCECGHVNPHGTIFCEACGKPVKDASNALLDMKYEGSARRSQTYNKTIIDKIWNFFSSVKVGVWLIVITLSASAIGTIYPQKDYIPPAFTPDQYYKDQYGILGDIYHKLGFDNLYGSWWYMILIASIGISLVICSLDRVIPLYKALKKQGVKRHVNFLKRQRLFSVSYQSTSKDYETVKQRLKERRYNVREEDGNILAEKGRFSRWGPYVNHIGLIIFLFGAMLRFVPGMYVDKTLWIREGETKEIPGTNGEYFLKNEQFVFQQYEKGKDKAVFSEAIDRVGSVPKNFQSNVQLYKRTGESVAGEDPVLHKVKSDQIQVNHPLKYDHYALYQSDFKLDELSTMSLSMVNKTTKEEYGTIKINLHDPQHEYDLKNGYKVELLRYYPDFYFDDENKPNTKTKIPNNPAFVMQMIAPDRPKGEKSFIAIRQNIEAEGTNKYKMEFSGIETKNVTGLTVHKDMTLWILAVGGAIFMIGVIQGMYWNHRRIWIQRKNNEVWIAAHTNKNWYGIRNELNGVLKDTAFALPEDQTENANKKEVGA
ncbi:cytochrome c biogenesis protein ResB [Priestia koreensis]|uniref:cytochrome c biogenesis protein ResB n=1 Tax=Priestia koreensis TaxID=284581 RepID=UPI0028F6DE58|nr:cytochrome c biogenesis protein ResB [Priestia koreensis]